MCHQLGLIQKITEGFYHVANSFGNCPAHNRAEALSQDQLGDKGDDGLCYNHPGRCVRVSSHFQRLTKKLYLRH